MMSSIMDKEDTMEEESRGLKAPESTLSTRPAVSWAFHDALTCPLYRLLSIVFFMESEAEFVSSLKTGRQDNSSEEDPVLLREECAQAMLIVLQSMSKTRSKLWKHVVADKTMALLPCRLAFQMLESARVVLAHKAALLQPMLLLA